MSRRRLRAGFVAMAATALVGAPVAATAVPSSSVTEASAASSWAGTAAADGVRVGVVVNDFLVVSNVVDAGGPAAQAVVNAFGDSRAYAAYPYPGEIVLTAHGLSQGAAPNYPLIAQSNSTQPDSRVSQGPYELHARSQDDTSDAVARSAAGGGGLAGGTTASTVSVVHDTTAGKVTSDAETTLEGISIDGVLHIGRFHSRAHMAAAPGAAVERTSDTEVSDVNVGGQEVGVTDKGLVLAGTDVPLPPDSTANAVLSGAGITLHYVAGTVTPSSVVAPGLSIALAQNVPGVGETTVTYVLGQAAVSALSSGATATSVGGAQVSGGAVASPPGNGGVATPVSSGPSAVSAPLANGIATAGAPDQGVTPMTAAAPGYRLVATSGASSASLYVVVAVGAIVMVGAAQLFRVLAVRLAWT